jgi:HAD superfamily phosphatase
MYTVEKARAFDRDRLWIGVGILPPHVQQTVARRNAYAQTLKAAGAAVIFNNIEELTFVQIEELIRSTTLS